MEAALIPFPMLERTPPVTKMNFFCFFMKGVLRITRRITWRIMRRVVVTSFRLITPKKADPKDIDVFEVSLNPKASGRARGPPACRRRSIRSPPRGYLWRFHSRAPEAARGFRRARGGSEG